MANWRDKINAYFERLFWSDNLLHANRVGKFEELQREPTPDELVLGWAEGTDEVTNTTTRLLKGILQEHRSTHMYVIGGSGVGKSKFLESLIEQDIKNGLGFGVIDPHGDLTEDVKGFLTLQKGEEFLRENVVLIDPLNTKETITFNPLEKIEGIPTAELAGELVLVFKKIWHDAWGARMEDLLKNSLIALIENNLTLVELPLFLTDPVVRNKVLEKVEHPVSRQYFERFNSLRTHTQDEWMESTLNKVRAFLSDERIRVIFAARKSSINLRAIMDNRKILLVKLESGRLKISGELLGSLLLAKIQMAAFSRTDTPEEKRVPFYLYVDEFQNYATESFADVLAQARKYKLSLILAHQNLAQLPSNLRASIFSNCTIQVYFRILRDDANILAKESLSPIYQQPPGWETYIQMLQELQPRQCAVKNKIEGGVVFIETLDVLPPHEREEVEQDEFMELVASKHIGAKYMRGKEEIEAEDRERHEELTRVEEPESFREVKQ